MTDHPGLNHERTFTALRPRLFSIAYRMLGIRADAEDVVQDAWLRWHGSEQAGVQSAEAWLVTDYAPGHRPPAHPQGGA